jgi:hypothetical protein
MRSSDKQLRLKARPRGHPWPKGVSGNPRGRPRGSLNKTTLAMLEDVRRAAEELARPLVLDKSKPYENWDGYFHQYGRQFDKRTLEVIPIDGSPPVQPERFNPRDRHTPAIWKNRRLLLQDGWAYDPATRQAVKP